MNSNESLKSFVILLGVAIAVFLIFEGWAERVGALLVYFIGRFHDKMVKRKNGQSD